MSASWVDSGLDVTADVTVGISAEGLATWVGRIIPPHLAQHWMMRIEKEQPKRRQPSGLVKLI